MVRFEDPSAEPDGDLHVCPRCESELVHPIEWGEVSGEQVDLTLHCPNCDWTRHGTHDQHHVATLEDRLDDGVAAILADLRRLTTANMAEEIERFTAALAHDQILPEDF